MEQKYRVFAEDYNKMLDLVEKVDAEVVEKYKKIISKMPTSVIEMLPYKKEFCFEGEDLRIDKDCYDEMIEFQYTTYRKYFNASMNIYPYYEDELLEDDEDEEYEEIEIDPEIEDEEDGNIFIFSLTMTNTQGEAKIKFNFEEDNGKYKYVGAEQNGIELDYSVFVERREDEFFLVSKHLLNGVEIKKIEKSISYEELSEYACEEKELEEDVDFESLSAVDDEYLDEDNYNFD